MKETDHAHFDRKKLPDTLFEFYNKKIKARDVFFQD